jgi:plastocyanin
MTRMQAPATRPATAPRTAPTTRPLSHWLLLAAGLAVVLGVFIAIGSADPVGFLTTPFTWIVLGIPLVMTVVAFSVRNRWTLLVASILVTLPCLLFFLFSGFLWAPLVGIPSAIAAPFIVFALLTALPAGIAAFRGRGPSVNPPAWTAPLGRWSTTAAAIAVGVLLVGVGANVQAVRGASSGGYDFDPVEVLNAERVEVEIREFKFQNTGFTVGKERIVEFIVSNRDGERHDFTYRVGGVDYKHELLPGTQSKFLAYFAQEGTIQFRCTPHSSGYDGGSDEMVGSFTVA